MLQVKRVNKEELINKGRQTIEAYSFKSEICQVIQEELKKIDGKKITKRVATSMENALKKIDAGLRVSYSKDSMGWYNFGVWSSSIQYLNYSNRLSLMISNSDLNDDETYNHEGFITRYKWLNNWHEHIAEIEKDLDMIENSNMIEEYNKAYELIESTRNSLSGLRYELTR